MIDLQEDFFDSMFTADGLEEVGGNNLTNMNGSSGRNGFSVTRCDECSNCNIDGHRISYLNKQLTPATGVNVHKCRSDSGLFGKMWEERDIESKSFTSLELAYREVAPHQNNHHRSGRRRDQQPRAMRQGSHPVGWPDIVRHKDWYLVNNRVLKLNNVLNERRVGYYFGSMRTVTKLCDQFTKYVNILVSASRLHRGCQYDLWKHKHRLNVEVLRRSYFTYPDVYSDLSLEDRVLLSAVRTHQRHWTNWTPEAVRLKPRYQSFRQKTTHAGTEGQWDERRDKWACNEKRTFQVKEEVKSNNSLSRWRLADSACYSEQRAACKTRLFQGGRCQHGAEVQVDQHRHGHFDVDKSRPRPRDGHLDVDKSRHRPRRGPRDLATQRNTPQHYRHVDVRWRREGRSPWSIRSSYICHRNNEPPRGRESRGREESHSSSENNMGHKHILKSHGLCASERDTVVGQSRVRQSSVKSDGSRVRQSVKSDGSRVRQSSVKSDVSMVRQSSVKSDGSRIRESSVKSDGSRVRQSSVKSDGSRVRQSVKSDGSRVRQSSVKSDGSRVRQSSDKSDGSECSSCDLIKLDSSQAKYGHQGCEGNQTVGQRTTYNRHLETRERNDGLKCCRGVSANSGSDFQDRVVPTSRRGDVMRESYRFQPTSSHSSDKREHSPAGYTSSDKRAHCPVGYTSSDKRAHCPVGYTSSDKRAHCPVGYTSSDKRAHSPVGYTSSDKRAHSQVGYTSSDNLGQKPPECVSASVLSAARYETMDVLTRRHIPNCDLSYRMSSLPSPINKRPRLSPRSSGTYPTCQKLTRSAQLNGLCYRLPSGRSRGNNTPRENQSFSELALAHQDLRPCDKTSKCSHSVDLFYNNRVSCERDCTKGETISHMDTIFLKEETNEARIRKYSRHKTRRDSLRSDTETSSRHTIGRDSLRSDTETSSRHRIGRDTIRYDTEINSRHRIGHDSLRSDTETSSRHIIGSDSLRSDTETSSRHRIGRDTIRSQTKVTTKVTSKTLKLLGRDTPVSLDMSLAASHSYTSNNIVKHSIESTATSVDTSVYRKRISIKRIAKTKHSSNLPNAAKHSTDLHLAAKHSSNLHSADKHSSNIHNAAKHSFPHHNEGKRSCDRKTLKSSSFTELPDRQSDFLTRILENQKLNGPLSELEGRATLNGPLSELEGRATLNGPLSQLEGRATLSTEATLQMIAGLCEIPSQLSPMSSEGEGENLPATKVSLMCLTDTCELQPVVQTLQSSQARGMVINIDHRVRVVLERESNYSAPESKHKQEHKNKSMYGSNGKGNNHSYCQQLNNQNSGNRNSPEQSDKICNTNNSKEQSDKICYTNNSPEQSDKICNTNNIQEHRLESNHITTDTKDSQRLHESSLCRVECTGQSCRAECTEQSCRAECTGQSCRAECTGQSCSDGESIYDSDSTLPPDGTDHFFRYDVLKIIRGDQTDGDSRGRADNDTDVAINGSIWDRFDDQTNIGSKTDEKFTDFSSCLINETDWCEWTKPRCEVEQCNTSSSDCVDESDEHVCSDNSNSGCSQREKGHTVAGHSDSSVTNSGESTGFYEGIFEADSFGAGCVDEECTTNGDLSLLELMCDSDLVYNSDSYLEIPHSKDLGQDYHIYTPEECITSDNEFAPNNNMLQATTVSDRHCNADNCKQVNIFNECDVNCEQHSAVINGHKCDITGLTCVECNINDVADFECDITSLIGDQCDITGLTDVEWDTTGLTGVECDTTGLTGVECYTTGLTDVECDTTRLTGVDCDLERDRHLLTKSSNDFPTNNNFVNAARDNERTTNNNWESPASSKETTTNKDSNSGVNSACDKKTTNSDSNNHVSSTIYGNIFSEEPYPNNSIYFDNKCAGYQIWASNCAGNHGKERAVTPSYSSLVQGREKDSVCCKPTATFKENFISDTSPEMAITLNLDQHEGSPNPKVADTSTESEVSHTAEERHSVFTPYRSPDKIEFEVGILNFDDNARPRKSVYTRLVKEILSKCDQVDPRARLARMAISGELEVKPIDELCANEVHPKIVSEECVPHVTQTRQPHSLREGSQRNSNGKCSQSEQLAKRGDLQLVTAFSDWNPDCVGLNHCSHEKNNCVNGSLSIDSNSVGLDRSNNCTNSNSGLENKFSNSGLENKFSNSGLENKFSNSGLKDKFSNSGLENKFRNNLDIIMDHGNRCQDRRKDNSCQDRLRDNGCQDRGRDNTNSCQDRRRENNLDRPCNINLDRQNNHDSMYKKCININNADRFDTSVNSNSDRFDNSVKNNSDRFDNLDNSNSDRFDILDNSNSDRFDILDNSNSDRFDNLDNSNSDRFDINTNIDNSSSNGVQTKRTNYDNCNMDKYYKYDNCSMDKYYKYDNCSMDKYYKYNNCSMDKHYNYNSIDQDRRKQIEKNYLDRQHTDNCEHCHTYRRSDLASSKPDRHQNYKKSLNRRHNDNNSRDRHYKYDNNSPDRRQNDNNSPHIHYNYHNNSQDRHHNYNSNPDRHNNYDNNPDRYYNFDNNIVRYRNYDNNPDRHQNYDNSNSDRYNNDNNNTDIYQNYNNSRDIHHIYGNSNPDRHHNYDNNPDRHHKDNHNPDRHYHYDNKGPDRLNFINDIIKTHDSGSNNNSDRHGKSCSINPNTNQNRHTNNVFSRTNAHKGNNPTWGCSKLNELKCPPVIQFNFPFADCLEPRLLMIYEYLGDSAELNCNNNADRPLKSKPQVKTQVKQVLLPKQNTVPRQQKRQERPEQQIKLKTSQQQKQETRTRQNQLKQQQPESEPREPIENDGGDVLVESSEKYGDVQNRLREVRLNLLQTYSSQQVAPNNSSFATLLGQMQDDNVAVSSVQNEQGDSALIAPSGDRPCTLPSISKTSRSDICSSLAYASSTDREKNGVLKFVQRLNTKYGDQLTRGNAATKERLNKLCNHYLNTRWASKEESNNVRTKLERNAPPRHLGSLVAAKAKLCPTVSSSDPNTQRQKVEGEGTRLPFGDKKSVDKKTLLTKDDSIKIGGKVALKYSTVECTDKEGEPAGSTRNEDNTKSENSKAKVEHLTASSKLNPETQKAKHVCKKNTEATKGYQAARPLKPDVVVAVNRLSMRPQQVGSKLLDKIHNFETEYGKVIGPAQEVQKLRNPTGNPKQNMIAQTGRRITNINVFSAASSSRPGQQIHQASRATGVSAVSKVRKNLKKTEANITQESNVDLIANTEPHSNDSESSLESTCVQDRLKKFSLQDLIASKSMERIDVPSLDAPKPPEAYDPMKTMYMEMQAQYNLMNPSDSQSKDMCRILDEGEQPEKSYEAFGLGTLSPLNPAIPEESPFSFLNLVDHPPVNLLSENFNNIYRSLEENQYLPRRQYERSKTESGSADSPTGNAPTPAGRKSRKVFFKPGNQASDIEATLPESGEGMGESNEAMDEIREIKYIANIAESQYSGQEGVFHAAALPAGMGGKFLKNLLNIEEEATKDTNRRNTRNIFLQEADESDSEADILAQIVLQEEADQIKEEEEARQVEEELPNEGYHSERSIDGVSDEDAELKDDTVKTDRDKGNTNHVVLDSDLEPRHRLDDEPSLGISSRIMDPEVKIRNDPSRSAGQSNEIFEEKHDDAECLANAVSEDLESFHDDTECLANAVSEDLESFHDDAECLPNAVSEDLESLESLRRSMEVNFRGEFRFIPHIGMQFMGFPDDPQASSSFSYMEPDKEGEIGQRLSFGQAACKFLSPILEVKEDDGLSSSGDCLVGRVHSDKSHNSTTK